MESTKRKYFKHKIGGKITVNHYLNTKLKPNFFPDPYVNLDTIELPEPSIEYYPLYIRVTVKRQTTSFPSSFGHYRAHLFTKKYYEQEIAEVREILAREIMIIKDIVESLRPFERDDFDIKEVAEEHFDLLAELPIAVEHKLIKKIKSCLEKDPCTRSSFSTLEYDYEKGMFNTNYQDKDNTIYLGEFIDWQKSSASELISILSKIIPSIQSLKEAYPPSVWGFENMYQQLMHLHYGDYGNALPLMNAYEWKNGVFQKFIRDVMTNQTEEVEALIEGLNRLLRD